MEVKSRRGFIIDAVKFADCLRRFAFALLFLRISAFTDKSAQTISSQIGKFTAQLISDFFCPQFNCERVSEGVDGGFDVYKVFWVVLFPTLNILEDGRYAVSFVLKIPQNLCLFHSIAFSLNFRQHE